jgi:hypothetical protein
MDERLTARFDELERRMEKRVEECLGQGNCWKLETTPDFGAHLCI